MPERQPATVVSENVGLNELVDRVDQLRERHTGHRGQVVNGKPAAESRRERRRPFRRWRHARQAPAHAVTHAAGQPILDERGPPRIKRNDEVVLESAEELNEQERIALDPLGLLEEFRVCFGSEHVGRELCDRFAVERSQADQLRSGLDELDLRLLYLI